MDRKSILEFARQLGLGQPAKSSTIEWVGFKCPFAAFKHPRKTDNTPSFGIYVSDKKKSGYNCFTCHSKGSFPSLAFELAHLLKKPHFAVIGREIQKVEIVGPTLRLRSWDEPPEEEIEHGSQEAPISWPDPQEEFRHFSAVGHSYLWQRGISWTTTISCGLRYDKSQQRIVFPVKDYAGRFGGFSGRYVGNSPGTQRNRPIKVRDYPGLRKAEIFLGEYRFCQGLSRSRCIVLVEGLFDYAAIVELGVADVGGLLGSALAPTKLRKLINWRRPVLLFLDNDVPGETATDTIINQLWGHVPILKVEYPEDTFNADPASLPPYVAKSMIRNAQQVFRKPILD